MIDKLKEIKQIRGFTLIELMIVVSIIGILSAVAVPGYMLYLKNSKTSEAKLNLKLIASGAVSYFESEHPIDAAGFYIRTKFYPATGDGKLIPEMAQTVGAKANPEDFEELFHITPWKELKFSVNKPFYYQYSYLSAENETLFGAQSNASLKQANDSTFQIKGNNCGIISSIIDISNETNTATPIVSTAIRVSDCEN